MEKMINERILDKKKLINFYTQSLKDYYIMSFKIYIIQIKFQLLSQKDKKLIYCYRVENMIILIRSIYQTAA